ncbi:MAG: DUF6340 family protein, partial [Flavobacteriales bacterium]
MHCMSRCPSPVILNKKACFLLFTAISMSSCRISMQVQFLKPAEGDHYAAGRKIAVACADVQDSIVPDGMPQKEWLDAVLATLAQSSLYEAIPAQQVFYNTRKSGLPLSERIAATCRHTAADALLLLDSMSVVCNQRSVKNYYDEWSVEEEVQFAALWRMHDASGKISPEEQPWQTKVVISSRGISKDEAIEQLYPSNSIIGDMAHNAGVDCGNSIAPHWAETKRFFYIATSSAMLKAAKYAIRHRWLKAAAIWQQVVCEQGGHNTKLAGKAAYNMAVACEM